MIRYAIFQPRVCLFIGESFFEIFFFAVFAYLLVSHVFKYLSFVFVYLLVGWWGIFKLFLLPHFRCFRSNYSYLPLLASFDFSLVCLEIVTEIFGVNCWNILSIYRYTLHFNIVSACFSSPNKMWVYVVDFNRLLWFSSLRHQIKRYMFCYKYRVFNNKYNTNIMQAIILTMFEMKHIIFLFKYLMLNLVIVWIFSFVPLPFIQILFFFFSSFGKCSMMWLYYIT